MGFVLAYYILYINLKSEYIIYPMELSINLKSEYFVLVLTEGGGVVL